MIEREENDGILTLRLAHGKVSAMDVELLEALTAAFQEAEGARAVVLTGTGGSFSAGVDLVRLTNEGEAYARRFFPALRDFILSAFTFPRPLVVAANGHAIAGGAVMTFAGDYRLMAEGNGRFGVPELLVGVPFPAIALELVRYGAPAQHVQSLVFTGRLLSPAEALAQGVVDEVVASDALLDRARQVADQLGRIPPEIFALTKRQLRADAVDRAARHADADARALELWASPETHTRIRDYLARTIKRST
ncbi:MAG TPA: enoyl-CoA hydratase/isomerase family protein [Longimicrobium sp.]|nr:enoyl-CoA hydratase/isomerase family protein [Longimicrobium sp.]